MKRVLVPLASLALAAATVGFGASAVAAPPSPDRTAGHSTEILGVVPTLAAAHSASKPRGAGSNLSYHGGPVMLTNTVHAIYWVPSGFSIQSGYDGLINQFFGDVAAASGATSNVYASDVQYYDSTNTHIAYSSTSGGSVVDTTSYPASGCTDSVSATTVCLSDAQIRAEIDRVAGANGWSRSGALFFMFTARGVGSCYNSSSCAFSSYCAYHSNFSSAAGSTLYANMPYADTVPSACDAGQHPNGNDADATINVTSHEHNEAITDALGTAWYDSRGYENGDKCAWNFGTVSGPSGAQYNQTIGAHNYFLQQEWSNATTSCVLHM